MGQQESLFSAGAVARRAAALDLEPLDATFRDAATAPFHAWFPYLEGYSPRFVRRVRAAYLPDSRRILEPFAGSGTTPIVLAREGVHCGYAEANPAMALIGQVKLAVLQPSTDRAALAGQLLALADALPERLSSEDAALNAAYHAVFGKSVFFDAPAHARVLQLRALNDALADEGALLADCFSVAVMAALLPCSRLKRAGDVRYKTEAELARGVPALLPAVRERLRQMAADIAVASPALGGARLLTDDARALSTVADAGRYDGVLTSPPYLNGTNYIRNARLELWYLRHLLHKSDLRGFRDTVVTAGINDVSAKTVSAPVSEGVAGVVRALEERAYDARIARMVGGYFVDMQAVLDGIRLLVRPGGAVCIDIGDSLYAGVHVPTDTLLADLAEALGFRLAERVYLRKRRSKGGQELRQVLLVLKAPPKPRSRGIEKKWATFCRTMPHQKPPYAKRNWGTPLHSLCSYQGKLKPALAHHLVEAFSAPGQLVVDPFSGAGTIPLQACATGRQGVGIDISGLGYVLTRAKVAVPEPEALQAEVAALEAALKSGTPTDDEHASARAVSFNSAIPDYFHPDTLREVLLARRFFRERWGTSDAWAFAYAACLHILHGNRPYALSRRSHPITPFAPTGPTEFRPLIPRLNAKIKRAMANFEPFSHPGVSLQGDCALPWGLPRPADAVITSPPFFDSTRFYMTNWMRYWFIGWERADFDHSVADFFETRQKASMDIYAGFFARAYAATRPGAYLVLHLGQSKKCDMAAELAERVPPGLATIGTFYEGVEHCESHGVRDKGTVKGHAYLVLRRR